MPCAPLGQYQYMTGHGPRGIVFRPRSSAEQIPHVVAVDRQPTAWRRLSVVRALRGRRAPAALGRCSGAALVPPLGRLSGAVVRALLRRAPLVCCSGAAQAALGRRGNGSDHRCLTCGHMHSPRPLGPSAAFAGATRCEGWGGRAAGCTPPPPPTPPGAGPTGASAAGEVVRLPHGGTASRRGRGVLRGAGPWGYTPALSGAAESQPRNGQTECDVGDFNPRATPEWQG